LVKFSPFCMPRPPEMMILAAVSSGRSDLDSSSPTKPEMPGGRRRAGSIGAVPPSPAAWKAAVRTVMTFLASASAPSAMALPA
jgi:hypothetical protein